jgi:hypothetical protein
MGSQSNDIAGSGRLRATDALDRRHEERLWQIISGLTTGDNYFVMFQHVPDGSRDGAHIQTAVLAPRRFTME